MLSLLKHVSPSLVGVNPSSRWMVLSITPQEHKRKSITHRERKQKCREETGMAEHEKGKGMEARKVTTKLFLLLEKYFVLLYKGDRPMLNRFWKRDKNPR